MMGTRRMLFFLLVGLGDGAAVLGAQSPIEVGDRRQVFIDGRFMAAVRGVTLEVKTPIKRGIVLQADDPQRTFIGQYGSVLEHDGVFHMWYQAHTVTSTAGVGDESEGRGYICYARSEDGVHWIKPKLGLAEAIPGAEPNIVVGAGAGSFPADMRSWNGGEAGNVFVDPTASPEERFRLGIREEVLSKEPGKFGLHLMSSPDGTHWRLTHRNVVNYWSPLPHLDTCNVLFWDPSRRTYRAYVRYNLRLPGGRNRAVAYGESPDLAHFPHVENMRLVMAHDGQDPSLPMANGRELRMVDYYTNATVKYPLADDAYYMFPSAYFHYEGVLPEFTKDKPVNAGTLDIRFAASRDGVEWNRYDRRPYVRPSPTGRWDARMLYMYRGLIPAGESRILLYYYGSDWDHGWWRDESNRRILRAAGIAPSVNQGAIGVLELRRDGFIAARAAYAGGEFTTPPLRFTGDELVVNIDTSAAGEARLELQDEAGIALPGFTLADCVSIHTANEISRRVRWQGGTDLSALAGKPVRVRFVMRDAELYAFQFRQHGKP